ncbi:hypothetical protein GGX14DRAFT_479899 [Mycena pura]|uniref:BTB domain-containing protein n=1 Tax=Mycena pura TaxID=153505 RepID=A0AAD6UQT6_9AGAR|nr:hypothetical protein GGX14DRAFT_479899 [Mycena pura]
MSVDTSTTDQTSALTEAEGLWFLDCGLIMQAENTLFRVSGDLLELHSPIFRHMLSRSLPITATMDMDGCQLVMLPDTAADITVFLKALIYYDFFEPPPGRTTLAILSGVLRMSARYKVDALYKRALAHLSAVHPTTLSGYKELEMRGGPNSLLGDLEEYSSSYIEVIVLAREFEIDWILPFAFYQLCRFAYEADVIEGPMTSDDKTRWVVGCRTLDGSENSRILDFLWSPEYIQGCTWDKCIDYRSTCRKRADKRSRFDADTSRILPLEVWTRTNWKGLDACDVCLSEMKKAYGAAKKSFWSRLPEIFALPKWSVLEKMKAEALKTCDESRPVGGT